MDANCVKEEEEGEARRHSGGRCQGSSLLLPAASDLTAPLPVETDVAIIGGGLAGCALAYYLAKAGRDVWSSSEAS